MHSGWNFLFAQVLTVQHFDCSDSPFNASCLVQASVGYEATVWEYFLSYVSALSWKLKSSHCNNHHIVMKVLLLSFLFSVSRFVRLKMRYVNSKGGDVLLFVWPGGPESEHAGRPCGLLWCHQPVRELWEHDHHLLHQGLLLWQAGGREGGGENGLKTG